MKNKFVAFIALFFLGFLVFADTSSNNSLGISDTGLNNLVKDYLENTFNRYLRRGDLYVTEVSCTDWNSSVVDKNLNYFIAQARFRNFPINNRFLTGRLETRLAVRKNSGSILIWGGKPGIEEKDQKDFRR